MGWRYFISSYLQVAPSFQDIARVAKPPIKPLITSRAAQMHMKQAICCQSSQPMWQIQCSRCGYHIKNYLGSSPVVSRSSVCLLTSLQLICEYFPFLLLTARTWYAAFCKRKIIFIMWILRLSGNVFLNASGNEMLYIHPWQAAAELNTKWQLREDYSSL